MKKRAQTKKKVDGRNYKGERDYLDKECHGMNPLRGWMRLIPKDGPEMTKVNNKIQIIYGMK